MRFAYELNGCAQETDEYLRLEIEKQKLVKQLEFEHQESVRLNEIVLQLKRDADKSTREVRRVPSLLFLSRSVSLFLLLFLCLL